MSNQTDILEAPASYTYAQLNGDDICEAVSQLSGEVIQDNMIDVTDIENSFQLLGMKYIRATKVWEPVEQNA